MRYLRIRQFALVRLAVLVIALASMGLSARAQQGDDLREAAQNPLGDLISLPFQNNTNFDIGHTLMSQVKQLIHALSTPVLLRDDVCVWDVSCSGGSEARRRR